MEQWRLATLSFQMWGALSPTKESPPTVPDAKKTDAVPEKTDHRAPTPKRSIGQAEIESAYYKVRRFIESWATRNDADNITQLVRWNLLRSPRNACSDGLRRSIFICISISRIVCFGK